MAQSQPGFLNFIVIPLFKALKEAVPAVGACVDSAEVNVTIWSIYKESEEDKSVYGSNKPEEHLLLKKNESIVSHSSLSNARSSGMESGILGKEITVVEEGDECSSHSSADEE